MYVGRLTLAMALLLGMFGAGIACADTGLPIYPGAVADSPPTMGPVMRCGHAISFTRYRGPAIAPTTVANWYGQRIHSGIQMNLNRTVGGDAIVSQAVMDPSGARAVAIEKTDAMKGVPAATIIEFVSYDPPESSADIARLRAAAAGNQPLIGHIKQACGFF